jgi:hypothetical protein
MKPTSGQPVIQHYEFTVQKRGSEAYQNDDRAAAAIDTSNGCAVAAVSDGATESVLSGKWAECLVQRFADDPQFPLTDQWVEDTAANFYEGIDFTKLPWYAVEKAVNGSQATLLGLRLDLRSGRWQATGKGDSMIAIVGWRAVPRPFAFKELGLNISPSSLSIPTAFGNRPSLVRSRTENGSIPTDDPFWHESRRISGLSNRWANKSFLLMTDALAAWFVSQTPLTLAANALLALDSQQKFEEFVFSRRNAGELKNDDTTLVHVSVIVRAR